LTVTGGEPMMQMEFLIELFEGAKKASPPIHTCLDTSGIMYREDEAFLNQLNRLMNATDLVMLDIKHIDDAAHKELTAHSNERILKFAKYLEKKNIPVWIRHVVVPGITLNEEALIRLGTFIGGLKNIKALDVLPYHTMGKAKYNKLGIDYPLAETPAATKDQAKEAKDLIMHALILERQKHLNS
jgi:pyruvate formate lyase activating enzyme